MVTMLDHFYWSVPKDGFAVDYPMMSSPQSVGVRGLRPLYGKTIKAGPEVREYDVYADMSLYRRFAKLPLPAEDESGVVEFANTYGLLDLTFFAPDSDTPTTEIVESNLPYYQVDFEPLDKWTQAIDAMRKALEWWDAMRLDENPQYWSHSLDNVLTSLLSHTCGVDVSTDRGQTRITHMPLNLMGAMWLQLANHVELKADYKPCEVCGHDFAVLPGDGRTRRRKTCSNRCKQERKKERPR